MSTINIRGLELMTTAQAAQALGISQRRVQQLCAAGRLGIAMGGRYMIALEEIKKFTDTPRRPGRPSKNELDESNKEKV